VRHQTHETLEILPGYPGTNSVDSQGPTPGVAGNTWLTLDSPLDPFTYEDLLLNNPDPNNLTKIVTSKAVVNIRDLGYEYEDLRPPLEGPITRPAPILTVSNINRATLGGSFLVSAWAILESGEKILVGTEAALSRWHVAGCQNCQNHLEFRAHIPIKGWSKEEAEKVRFRVHLHTRTLNRGDCGSGPQQGVQNPKFKLGTDHL
ncbi:hypothetical protein BGZ65_008151, partial [Modicella reniformis]